MKENEWLTLSLLDVMQFDAPNTNFCRLGRLNALTDGLPSQNPRFSRAALWDCTRRVCRKVPGVTLWCEDPRARVMLRRFHSGDEIHRLDKLSPAIALRSQNLFAFRCEPVVTASSLAGLFHPATLNPSSFLQAIE